MYAGLAEQKRAFFARRQLFSGLFSLFSLSRASARLRLKKKKSLENLSAAGACSFHGTDFRHNDKGTAVNTLCIYKVSAKVRTKISPSKPIRVRLFSAYRYSNKKNFLCQ